MNNDSLKKWALVAEILGGLSVVLSLIFVGVQIRQGSEQTELNTRAVEISAYQDLINQMGQMYIQALSDPELNDLIVSFQREELDPNETELNRLYTYMGYVFRHSEMSFLQFDRGLINEEQLYSVTFPLRRVLGAELGYQYWSVSPLPKNFMSYIEVQKQAGWPPPATN